MAEIAKEVSEMLIEEAFKDGARETAANVMDWAVKNGHKEFFRWVTKNTDYVEHRLLVMKVLS